MKIKSFEQFKADLSDNQEEVQEVLDKISSLRFVEDVWAESYGRQPRNPKMFSVRLKIKGEESRDVLATTGKSLRLGKHSKNSKAYKKYVKPIEDVVSYKVKASYAKTSVEHYDPAQLSVTLVKQ